MPSGRITRYPIAAIPFITAILNCPVNSIDISFDIQNDMFALWTVVTATTPMHLRYFEMRLTGELVDLTTRQPIISFQDGAFVGHIFEIAQSQAILEGIK